MPASAHFGPSTAAPFTLAMAETDAVSAPVAVQLAVPHAKPLRQQPPPTSAPHANQPPAQPPWTPPGGAPVGASNTVTPLLTSRLAEARAGHDALAQSRPTWQQDPPAKKAAHW